MQVKNVDASVWSSIVLSFEDCTFEQTLGYARGLAELRGSDARFVVVEQDGRPIGAACVRIKKIPVLNRGIAYIASGPLYRSREYAHDVQTLELVLNALKSKFVEQEGHVLQVRMPATTSAADNETLEESFFHAGFELSKYLKEYNTIVVDVTRSPEELKKALHGKWRTDLNYSIKHGVITECGTDEEFRNRFLKIYHQVKNVKGFVSDLTPEYFFSLPDADENIEIVIAKHLDKDIAGHMSFYCGNTGCYLFGGTTIEGRDEKAGYLVNWAALLNAHEKGVTCFDLGGVDKENNKDVFRFKSRMGGQFVTTSMYVAYKRDPIGLFVHTLVSLLQKYRR